VKSEEWKVESGKWEVHLIFVCRNLRSRCFGSGK